MAAHRKSANDSPYIALLRSGFLLVRAIHSRDAARNREEMTLNVIRAN
jgi:hypothetical protein